MKIQNAKQHTILLLVMIVWLFVAIQIVSFVASRASVYPIGYSNTGALFIKRPYCAIDPMCIDVITHNPGPYIHGMPSISGYSEVANQRAAAFSVTNFAWSNYIFFMLLLMTIVWGTSYFIKKSVIRNAVLIFIAAWCVQGHMHWENLREMGTATSPTWESAQTMFLMMFSIGLLLVVWCITRNIKGANDQSLHKPKGGQL